MVRKHACKHRACLLLVFKKGLVLSQMILVLFLHCEWLRKECLICLELSITNLLPLAVEHLLETCGVTSLVLMNARSGWRVSYTQVWSLP